MCKESHALELKNILFTRPQSSSSDMFFNLLYLLGCHARAVPQADQPLAKWEETVDQFWQFVSELNTHGDTMVENMKASQLNKDLE